MWKLFEQPNDIKYKDTVIIFLIQNLHLSGVNKRELHKTGRMQYFMVKNPVLQKYGQDQYLCNSYILCTLFLM